MLFVVISTWATEKTTETMTKTIEEKLHEDERVKEFWVLPGRCKSVILGEFESPEEIFKFHMPVADLVECEWAPALTVEEGVEAAGM